MPINALPLGPEFRVNTEEAGHQFGGNIAALPDGGYIITWESVEQDGDSRGIYAQRYDAVGATVGTEFRVNTETTGAQQTAFVSVLADGGFVITWSSAGQDGSGDGVYGQRYAADGSLLGSEFQVNSFVTGDQNTPVSAGLSDGGFVVAWVSLDQDGDSYGIFAQRFNADGGAVGAEFQVNTNVASIQHYPDVVGMDDGGFLIVWPSFDIDGEETGVAAQRYDAGGSAVGTEFQVNTTTALNQRQMSVTVLSDGGFVVAWISGGPSESGFDYNIIGQRFDESGALVGGEFQINDDNIHNQNYPNITAMADGGFLAVWESGHQDGSSDGLFAQRFDAAGAPVGAEFQVNTFTTGNQSYPHVTALNDGSYMVAWSSEAHDYEGWGMYAQQFAAQLFGTADNNMIDDTIGANWLDGRGGRDVLYGNSGFDTLLGHNGADTLFGGTGADEVLGGAGKDKLFGEAGNDLLFGQGGNDILYGGAGRDRINGGAGADKLYGGDGADVFVFDDIDHSPVTGRKDIIWDFESGADRIDFSGAVSGLTFIDGARFSGTGPEIRAFINATGRLAIRVDTDGDGDADMRVLLDGVGTISADDFIL